MIWQGGNRSSSYVTFSKDSLSKLHKNLRVFAKQQRPESIVGSRSSVEGCDRALPCSYVTSAAFFSHKGYIRMFLCRLAISYVTFVHPGWNDIYLLTAVTDSWKQFCLRILKLPLEQQVALYDWVAAVIVPQQSETADAQRFPCAQTGRSSSLSRSRR
jgi:hypothetical protein